MRTTFIIVFLFICLINIQAQQTNANIPGPENVLVVYNTLDQNSIFIKDYYKNARNIPTINILGLSTLADNIWLTDSVSHVSHLIKIVQNSEIIKDIDQTTYDSLTSGGASFHAYQYFYERIASPIKTYLENTYSNGQQLKDVIRYILLCPKVPLKIQARYWDSVPGNVAVDGVLCILNTAGLFDYLKLIYNSNLMENSSINSIDNPYFDVDLFLQMTCRFVPGVYSVDNRGFNVKLSYLVSRLDGLNATAITGMIDRSVAADKSGTGIWIIDDDPDYSFPLDDLTGTKIAFEYWGFPFVHDTLQRWITSNSSSVIGYSSKGVHAADILSNPPTASPSYIQDSLNFTYLNGAVFNSWESFNGNSISTLTRRYIPLTLGVEHGLTTEFILTGGTGGVCHTNEPFTYAVNKSSYFFPAYAMGYNLVDAAYRGIKYLVWQNVVIGDPLTTIAWGKQSLISNLNWSGTNLVTGEVEIPTGKTLTIADSSTINLRHQGFITGNGELILGQNVIFNIYSWQKGLFLSYDGDSPRLVWGAHPTLGPAVYYKVYRKVGTGLWELLTTTTALQYTDTQILFSEFGEGDPNIFYKVLAYTQLPTTYESNTVSCFGNKNPKKIVVRQHQNLEIEYSLRQNYPNPFNPITKINYSIKNAGLVQIKIYDILGSEVAIIVNEEKLAGKYEVNFNASSLASGVYIYKIQSGSFINSKKMILLK